MELEVYTPIEEVLIYDWDALFGDWKVKSAVGGKLPDWSMHGGSGDNYLSLCLIHKVFSDEFYWHMYVSTNRLHTWKNFSWMKHLSQGELLGMANYLHRRDPFIPLEDSDTDVLGNLVKYGVLGRTVDDGVKKVRFWQKKL